MTVVSQTTALTTPTITGTVTLNGVKGETLSVTVNGVTYKQGDPALTVSGGSWSLVIPVGDALTPATVYDVTATIINADMLVLEDATSAELTITGSGPGMTVTKTALADGLSAPVIAGDELHWTIEATNTGSEILSPVTVVDTLQAAASHTLTATPSLSNTAVNALFEPG